jgi:hypothetical protein
MLVSKVRGRRRWGGTLVEMSMVGSTALLLLIGMIIMGLGVFRYQQLGSLAREGARWASVHGPGWQSNQAGAMPTSSTVMTSAIKPMAVGLDTTKIVCDLEWPSPNGTAPTGMVSVTLTYTWTPEAFLSPVTLKSTSTVPILY